MGVSGELNFQGALLEATHAGQGSRQAATMNFPWSGFARAWQSLCGHLRKLVARPRTAGRMQLLERVTVAPRHQLVLVEIDGERCLLTLAPNAGIGFHPLGTRPPSSSLAADKPGD